jgi:membrane fusion protein, multidrug efflux system
MSRYLRCLATGLCALALAGCQAQTADTKRQPLFVRVQTAEVAAFTPKLELTGSIAARSQTDLAFKTAGRVTAVDAKVGQHVDAGDVVARINDTSLKADVAAAQAGVVAAQAQLTQAQATYDRQKSLLDQGFATRATFDTADTSLKTAEAGLDSARAAQASAEENLADAVLTTAASGIVTAVDIELGEVVEAGAPVLTVAEDAERDALFNVPETALLTDMRDTEVAVRLVSDPAVATTGKVREISPTLDSTSGTIDVRVGLVGTPAAMGLGAPVVGSADEPSSQRIIVPWSALWARDGAPAVWVVDGASHAVSVQPVTVALYLTGQVVLADGLKPGQIVVTEGTKMLSPGLVVSYEGSDK